MKTKAEKIKSLIDNPKSGFTADDVKVLEGFSEERLETLAATAQKAADELKAAQDATAKAEADKKAAEDLKAAAEKSEAEIKAAAAKPKSEEELLAQYPSIKTLVDNARATEAAKKTALVTTLKAAQTVYSEERLNAMGVEQLEEIAQLTKAAAPVDQSGRGAPRALAADDPNKIPPPPDLNARIRTAAGKEPVTKH